VEYELSHHQKGLHQKNLVLETGGLGGVILGGLGRLKPMRRISHTRLGVVLVVGCEVDTGSGELWAPFELGGSEVLGAILAASRVKDLSILEDSPPS
jgi:hypothetical protein